MGVDIGAYYDIYITIKFEVIWGIVGGALMRGGPYSLDIQYIVGLLYHNLVKI